MPRLFRYICVFFVYALMGAIAYGCVRLILTSQDSAGFLLIVSPALLWAARLIVAKKTGFISQRVRWPFSPTAMDSALTVWNSTKYRRSEQAHEFSNYFRTELTMCGLVWMITIAWTLPWLFDAVSKLDNPISKLRDSALISSSSGQRLDWSSSKEQWHKQCLAVADANDNCLTKFAEVVKMNLDSRESMVAALLRGADSWSQTTESQLLGPSNPVANNLITVIKKFDKSEAESGTFYSQLLAALQCGKLDKPLTVECQKHSTENAVYVLNQLSLSTRNPKIESYFAVSRKINHSLIDVPVRLHPTLKEISCRYELGAANCEESE